MIERNLRLVVEVVFRAAHLAGLVVTERRIVAVHGVAVAHILASVGLPALDGKTAVIGVTLVVGLGSAESGQ